MNCVEIPSGMKDTTTNETKFNGIVGMIQRNVRIDCHSNLICLVQLSLKIIFK